MPLRTVELFRLGHFRMAVLPGVYGLDWPEGFAALERYVADQVKEIAALDYGCYLNPTGDTMPHLDGPKFEGQAGFLDLVVDPVSDRESVRVYVKASLVFRRWPLGGWVVWDGFRAWPDGSRAELTKEDLAFEW